jgi:hypothetical protein
LREVLWQQDSTYYAGKCVGYDAALALAKWIITEGEGGEARRQVV